jgi:hypothetical protein
LGWKANLELRKSSAQTCFYETPIGGKMTDEQIEELLKKLDNRAASNEIDGGRETLAHEAATAIRELQYNIEQLNFEWLDLLY